MLQKISCHRVLTTRASLSPLLAGIMSLTPTDFPFSIEEIPTLAQCYPYLGRETYSDIFVPYPALEKPQGMDDVILYLHSSGSTGFPKPIPQTNTTVLHWYSLGISFFRSVMQMLILIPLYRMCNGLSLSYSSHCSDAPSFLPYAWNRLPALLPPGFCFFGIRLPTHIFHRPYQSSCLTHK
jgi:hypothetical protein